MMTAKLGFMATPGREGHLREVWVGVCRQGMFALLCELSNETRISG